MAEKNMSTLNDSQKIGLGGLVVNGMAYLSPACILMYYGIVNVMTGGSFPLAVLIAGLCIIPTAASYVKMSNEFPKGGSVFTYASATMGGNAGFLIGWLLVLDYTFLGVVCALSSGIYLEALIPAIPAWVGIVITVAIVTFLCYRGIKMATVFNTISIIVPVLMLLVSIFFMIKVMAAGGPETTGTIFATEALYNPDLFEKEGLLTACAFLCVLYVGFDAITTLGDETRNAKKNIPRGVWIVCLYAVISFSVLAFLMNCTWLYQPGAFDNPDTALTEFYEYIGAGWMNIVFVPVNTLCCVGCTITAVLAATRILKNMGKNGYLPAKVFAYEHPRFHTPSRNVLIYGAISLVSILFIGNLTALSNVASFGCLLSFAATNISVFILFWIRKKRRGGKAVLIYIILPFFAAGINIFLWLQLDWLARIIGCSWFLIGFICLLIGTKGFKVKKEVNLEED